MTDSIDLSWFDLDNYCRFENMTIREWACEICNREYLNSDIFNDKIDNNPESIKKCIDNLNGVFNKKEKIEREIVKHLNENNSKELAKNQEKTASIRPLIFFDLWQIMFFNKRIVKRHWNACMRIQQGIIRDSKSIAFDYIDDAINESSFKKLGVDLNSSDEQLISDFSSWLNYARQQQKKELPKKFFTQKDFNKWVKYQYIPCIDLILIAKLQKKNITNPKIASLIFPNELDRGDVDLNERVRKMRKSKIMALISNNISCALHKQADLEQSKLILE